MAVSGIGGVLNAIGLTGANAPTSPTGAGATGAAGGADPGGNVFTNMLENMQATQNNAADLAQAAATGNLTDIHTYTIAATEAQLMTDLTVAVRDRAVESFNEIMRMQA